MHVIVEYEDGSMCAQGDADEIAAVAMRPGDTVKFYFCGRTLEIVSRHFHYSAPGFQPTMTIRARKVDT